MNKPRLSDLIERIINAPRSTEDKEKLVTPAYDKKLPQKERDVMEEFDQQIAKRRINTL